MRQSKKMLKFVSLILVVLTIVLCTLFSTSAGNNIQPLYNNTASTSVSLSISGINSTSCAQISTSRSMQINITMELQKLKSGSYETIKTWTASRTGTILAIEKTRLINALATYRLKVTFDAGADHIVKYAYPS